MIINLLTGFGRLPCTESLDDKGMIIAFDILFQQSGSVETEGQSSFVSHKKDEGICLENCLLSNRRKYSRANDYLAFSLALLIFLIVNDDSILSKEEDLVDLKPEIIDV
ncbi:hypothetical protein Tco_0420655 [Tanacetum coccineum]